MSRRLLLMAAAAASDLGADGRVDLADLIGDREVEHLLVEHDNESAEHAGLNVGGEQQLLIGGDLSLERRLESLELCGLQRLGRGDRRVHLLQLERHQLVEVGHDLLDAVQVLGGSGTLDEVLKTEKEIEQRDAGEFRRRSAPDAAESQSHCHSPLLPHPRHDSSPSSHLRLLGVDPILLEDLLQRLVSRLLRDDGVEEQRSQSHAALVQVLELLQLRADEGKVLALLRLLEQLWKTTTRKTNDGADGP